MAVRHVVSVKCEGSSPFGIVEDYSSYMDSNRYRWLDNVKGHWLIVNRII